MQFTKFTSESRVMQGRWFAKPSRAAAFAYHPDGRLARVDYGNGKTEDFVWDGLALVKRGGEQFVNEPHIGGGNPVASSNGTAYFNDILGATVGVKRGRKYSVAALTAFGEGDVAFFTGNPLVPVRGRIFLFRNYRPDLAKWQTADPLGYPDGWNSLAYCNNSSAVAMDWLGCYVKIVGECHDPASETQKKIDMGFYDESGRICHWHIIQTIIGRVIIGQDFVQKRRWESIDGLEDILNRIGFDLNISGGCASVTGIGTIPAAGIVFGGVLCHTAAAIVDALNGYVDVTNGATFELSRKQIVKDSFELHVSE